MKPVRARATQWRLLGLLGPYAGLMALSVLLGAATVGAGIGLMAAGSYIIASAALHPSVADLMVPIVGVRFFGVARGALRYLERYVSHTLTFRLLARLRTWFYQAVEPLAPARLFPYASGDLLSRVVADVEELQHFYIRAVAPPLVALLVGGIVCAFTWAFDPSLAWATLLGMLAAGAGVPWLVRHLGRGLGREATVARAALATQVVSGIQGLSDLLALDAEVRHQERVRELGRRRAKAERRMAEVAALHVSVSTLTSHLTVWGVVVLGVSLVGEGRLAGVFLPVVALAVLASFEAVNALPLAAQHWEGSLEAGRRLFEVVDAGPVVREPASPSPLPAHFDLSVRDLRFRYAPGEPLALDGLSFDLPAGGRLAIVGPSGAGKSSLVHLLLRFWEYQEGEIRLGGHDLRQLRQADLACLINVVPQRPHLFNGTIRDNLRLAAPQASEEKLVWAAEQAQLHAFVQSLPRGYDTWVGEQGLRLSGGERQRLAIARALLRDAPILVLDEPTANLDSLAERDLLRSIHKVMVGRTVLMITHRLVGLEHFDEILVLRAGQLVERGRHNDLLEMGGYYYRMWDSWRQALAVQTEGSADAFTASVRG